MKRPDGHGYLIAIEGLGGTGKSTIARRLARVLGERGVDAVLTREPGGTRLGAELRQLLLGGKFNPAPMADTFLFEADRAQSYAEVIIPSLRASKVVICDRNLYGTIAYQGYGSGVDIGLIDAANRAATSGYYPDLVLVLDTDPDTAAARRKRQGQSDRFDERGMQFQERVRAGFLFAADRDHGKAHIIDSTPSLEEVADRVLALVWDSLPARLKPDA